MSSVCEMAIFPVNMGESVSSYVAKAVSIIAGSGMDYEIGPMGTSFEGEIDQVMQVSAECLKQMAADNNRVYMVLKIDYRAGMDGRLSGKVKSLKEKLKD